MPRSSELRAAPAVARPPQPLVGLCVPGAGSNAAGLVPVLPGDDEDALAARVLTEEHRIYPQAVRWLCEDRITLDVDGRVRISNVRSAAGTRLSPPPDA